MKNVLFILFLMITTAGAAQNRSGKSFGFYITNNHTSYPFASFSKLFVGQVHPGFEAGYGGATLRALWAGRDFTRSSSGRTLRPIGEPIADLRAEVLGLHPRRRTGAARWV